LFLLTETPGPFQLSLREIETLSILIHRAFHAAPHGATTKEANASIARAQGNGGIGQIPALNVIHHNANSAFRRRRRKTSH
jgi:hypothetical protein